MENKVSLLELDFKNFSSEEKRVALTLMDIMMKHLHEHNMMVTDFRPSQIYYQNGIYTFEKISPISSYYSDNKENAILRNVLGLTNLAFCSYLPDYRLEQGLLNYEVVHQNFNNLTTYLPEEDRDYYKSVFVDSYSSKKLLCNPVYFSDYVVKQYKSNASNNKSTSLAYIKATEAGRAFARQDDEAAFGDKFFLLTAVASLSVILFGVLFYFLAI